MGTLFRGPVGWGEVGGGGVKRKDNSEKIDFIWKELSFFTMVIEDEAVIAAQVDLKTSTLKPLHAYWVINTHNLILNAQN